MGLQYEVQKAVAENGGKLPFTFIQEAVENADVKYHQLSPSMRVCVIRLGNTNHEVIGVAQVLDAANDSEEIGNQVAFENAKNELWKVFGAIAIS